MFIEGNADLRLLHQGLQKRKSVKLTNCLIHKDLDFNLKRLRMLILRQILLNISD